MKFSTALRQATRRRLERLGSADILIGIPCFNNDTTIAHVIKSIEEGLTKYYSKKRCVVMISDGGSVDDSREVSLDMEFSPWIERVVCIYRGVPGKGTAVRALFEAANLLKCQATVLFDSDLRSISPQWVQCMVDAVLKDGRDFIAPYYTRYKYDGTITNNIVYNLTRALYGYRVRQPIGGDFAFSLPLIKKYIQEEVWESDVARFGIDIWLTTIAMVYKARIVQANLGVKIHDVKDPAETLAPMFRQVVFTMLELMEQHEKIWRKVAESNPVPIVGSVLNVEPIAFNINVAKLIHDFKVGYRDWKEIWQKIIAPDNWKAIENIFMKDGKSFILETENWAKILYDLAAAFHHWKDDRHLLVNVMTPLYFARVASFVNQSFEMNNAEAEELVEQQAEIFEQAKDYLIKRWEENTIYS